MINDPRDLNGSLLKEAMLKIGRNENLRKDLIAFLKNAETLFNDKTDVRSEITGPIIDALHDEKDIYEKILNDGTRFRFLFRTKIARDFLMSNQEYPNHVWEPQTTKLLLKLSEKLTGDVIVGGAYFGDQAILVAKKIHLNKVHCFEPNQDQFGMLVENAKINQLNNLVANRLGLWSESSLKLKLEGFDSFANAVLAESDEDGFNTVTIDDYSKKLDIKISLIQLDIEGAELGALKGANEVLYKDHPIIIFEVHKHYVNWDDGLANTEICLYLSGIGYKLYAIRDINSHMDMQGKQIELIPLDSIYLNGPPHGFNMIAIFDDSIFNDPDFKIVKNVSPKLLLHKDPALHHPTDGF
jgi:FkbM family methyltransferase